MSKGGVRFLSMGVLRKLAERPVVPLISMQKSGEAVFLSRLVSIL